MKKGFRLFYTFLKMNIGPGEKFSDIQILTGKSG